MLNINQVTSSLASMPDQALQQFASMHKADPYMLSLAMSESSRRKQLRTAMTPQPGEAPKVVDQAIAEMAPPEYFDDTADASASGQAVNGTGIAALPAGDMEFAAGGIVSFADGGETSSPYGRALGRWWDDVGNTVSGWAQESRLKGQIRDKYGSRAAVLGGFMAGSDAERANAQAIMDSLGGMSPAQMQQLLASGQLPDMPGQAGGGRGSYLGFDSQAAAAAIGGAPAPASPLVTSPAPTAPGLPRMLVSQGAPRSASAAGTPGGSRPSTSGAALQGGLESMFRKLMGSRVDELRNDMDKREADYAANRPPSEDYAEHKALLGEDTFERDKEHAQGLALLSAANAIMQGRQSTLQALVSGATEGGKAYASSMKELKAAQREHKKGLADLAVAQRAAARGDFDQAQLRKEKGLDRISAAQDTAVNWVAKAYETGADQSFQMRKLREEQRGRMQIAQVQAAASGGGRSGGGASGVDVKQINAERQIIATRMADLKARPSPENAGIAKQLQDRLDYLGSLLNGGQVPAPLAKPTQDYSAYGNLQTLR